ncbi:MAG TPA: glycoside hydrolase family 19 protein [Sphingomicrobium sp.]
MPARKLNNPAAFFDSLRQGLLGPTLSETEVRGCEAIANATGAAGWPISWAAYGLATAYHETAHTMQPITEYGGPMYFFRMYDPYGQRPKVAKQLGNTQRGDGERYCGRGYVQLTGRANYRHAGQELGIDLETHPELALNPDVAARILVAGMSEGWFTQQSCKSCMPNDGECDASVFSTARKIINGRDCAPLIASYAVKFQDALRAGDWQ